MFKYSIIIRWHLGWLSRTRSCASHGSSHGVYIGWMLKALRKSQNPRSKRSLWSTDQFDKSTCLGQQELRSNREGGSNPSSHVFQLDTTCVQTDSNHRHSLTLLPSLFAQAAVATTIPTLGGPFFFAEANSRCPRSSLTQCGWDCLRTVVILSGGIKLQNEQSHPIRTFTWSNFKEPFGKIGSTNCVRRTAFHWASTRKWCKRKRCFRLFFS